MSIIINDWEEVNIFPSESECWCPKTIKVDEHCPDCGTVRYYESLSKCGKWIQYGKKVLSLEGSPDIRIPYND